MSLTDPGLSKPGEQEDALRELLDRHGWHLFCDYVQREWGPTGVKFHAELTNALNLTDNNAAASQARQIVSGQKAILALLRWPSEEVSRLKRLGEKPEPEVASMSRGGYAG